VLRYALEAMTARRRDPDEPFKTILNRKYRPVGELAGALNPRTGAINLASQNNGDRPSVRVGTSGLILLKGVHTFSYQR